MYLWNGWSHCHLISMTSAGSLLCISLLAGSFAIFTFNVSLLGTALLSWCFDNYIDKRPGLIRHVRRGQWLRGQIETFKQTDTIQLVFILPPVKNPDILVHCHELFLHITGYSGLIIWSCKVLSGTTNLFYFKLNDISSAVNTAWIAKTHFGTVHEAHGDIAVLFKYIALWLFCFGQFLFV